jgi:hypothetical protein
MHALGTAPFLAIAIYVFYVNGSCLACLFMSFFTFLFSFR